ncbi:hypothetical protein CVM52_22880 [Pseudooceanicola lipolyticus]|uniref:NrS-1 polymerase-like helicase domain-containing protein n=2 Tax=Pseudooceanicola lipolyticus TaxID=2029104 RepID=A0A2M8IUV1_9RHOB|nr:hypothetical protein CVM52_22880 [Pseudooceanicola lipolyticus]
MAGHASEPFFLKVVADSSAPSETAHPSGESSQGRNDSLAFDAVSTAKDAEDRSKDEQACTKTTLCQYLANTFVRRDGKFYSCDDTSASFSLSDLKRIALLRIRARFPHVELSDELWKDVIQFGVEKVHTDQKQSVQVWNGRVECHPTVPGKLVPRDGSVTVNAWSEPAYRRLGETEADFGMFTELLNRVFVQPADRERFADWLSWNLQNEGQKCGWVVLLFSRRKGTGKTTVSRLLAKLFGEENSLNLINSGKLTAKFNQTVMTKKFVVADEVQMRPGTEAANALKSLITEPTVAIEGKGKEVTSAPNVGTYFMTTNGYPHWIEEGDRRFLVVDANHEFHAMSPNAAEFQSFMAEINAWMNEPRNIARLYNALMVRKQANSFNPWSLGAESVTTPLMAQLHAASGEVLQQELEESIAAQGVFAIPQTTLRKWFAEKLKANPNRIPHFMHELGWHQEKAKWGGFDYARSIWVHPDYQVSGGRVRGPDGYDELVSAVEEAVEII